MNTTHRLILAGLLTFTSLHSYASRVVTDQIGREVTIPDQVDRVVVLQHQTLNLLVQLNATDKVVGILTNWKQQLGDGYAQLVPELTHKAMLGDLTHVDLEKLVALHPQVVFVTNYAPKEMIDQISALGIPVLAISLRHDDAGQQGKINPTMQNEDRAYDLGIKEGITLIGEVVNKQQQANDLIAAAFAGRKLVSDRLKNLPDQQRVRAYMANPDLTTYGSGKYTGLMMAHAGALNVAAATVQGFKQVSMEQVVAWDPQVVQEINQDPRWRTISAVKNHQVWLMPEYAKAWGYPMPEAIGLGELWMAKKLYPEKFRDIDMQQQANRWYQRFYRTSYHDNTADTGSR
ncbi:ABC transporter substrate-binding protein [Pantoea sp. EA-12]|uniref:ABC transporter substrate-binding protein n=1 Tax=Pantoea sp. EA-12 TaxID=3043303 RepID=UPI0024B4DCCD|nr:ABC transporter substrate-binding protein [Pantoea sp. EA-12]MDI9223962.1 ABC transporter substrate-binding protein [Pantoea sp. EA-12]